MKSLLQRCVKQYGMAERYRNHLLMLRLWIMLANTMDDPLILFHFLKVMGEKMKEDERR
jgi:hypothetical protein